MHPFLYNIPRRMLDEYHYYLYTHKHVHTHTYRTALYTCVWHVFLCTECVIRVCVHITPVTPLALFTL